MDMDGKKNDVGQPRVVSLNPSLSSHEINKDVVSDG
jgi:hypothetical protein